MDYRKEHNGWLTFHEHWGILVMVLLLPIVMILFSFLEFLHSHKYSMAVKSRNCNGCISSDAGSIYWCVLSKPETNQIQFVIMLPATTTTGPAGGDAWPSRGDDYCYLQVKGNGHQWKIENIMDWKSGVQTVRLRDLTANTISSLGLNEGRFWKLDGEGHATPLETIDAATMTKIFSQVKAGETNLAVGQATVQN